MENIHANNEALKRNSKFKQLTTDQRNGILQKLLQLKEGQKLKHGAINKVAVEFGVTRLTVSRIWKEAQKQYGEGKIFADVSSKKKEKCGRKRKDYSEHLSKVKEVPFSLGVSIRSLSCATNIPKSTLFDKIKRISAIINPYKIPHINMAKLHREGELPVNLVCPKKAPEKARSHIN